MYCTKLQDLEESRTIFKNPVPNFYQTKCLFPLENRNVTVLLGFEPQKSGQFRLNRDGWQVCENRLILKETTFRRVDFLISRNPGAV